MRVLFAVLVIVAVAGCSVEPRISDVQAKRLADSIISQEYNIKNLSALRVTTQENADSWTFVYDPVDENSLGGPFMVKVDKLSGKVIDFRGYQ